MSIQSAINQGISIAAAIYKFNKIKSSPQAAPTSNTSTSPQPQQKPQQKITQINQKAEQSLQVAQEQKRMKKRGPKSFDEKVQILRDAGLPKEYVDKLNKQGVDTAYQSVKKGGKQK